MFPAGNSWIFNCCPASVARNWSKHVDSVKYLGVTITNDLCWHQNIASITLKATNWLNFLRRNIRMSNTRVKQTEYKTLVRTPLDTARPFGTHTLRQSPKLEAVSLFAPEALVHLKCRVLSFLRFTFVWKNKKKVHRGLRLVCVKQCTDMLRMFVCLFIYAHVE